MKKTYKYDLIPGLATISFHCVADDSSFSPESKPKEGIFEKHYHRHIKLRMQRRRQLKNERESLPLSTIYQYEHELKESENWILAIKLAVT